MKSSPSDNPSWDGTNTSGFSGLARGYRDGDFNSGGDFGYFWSASAGGTTLDLTGEFIEIAWYLTLRSGHTIVSRYNYNRRRGFSVRCVRD